MIKLNRFVKNLIKRVLKIDIIALPSGRATGYFPNLLAFQLDKIPGMISLYTAQIYFLLSVNQNLTGDIVEIGAWQGKSTIPLARSCEQRGLGEKVLVYEHFKGNQGKEQHYIVFEHDLKDLKGNFQLNIAAQNLDKFVKLHAIDVGSVKPVKRRDIRMLVIDGEHTQEAVLANYLTFKPMLLPGALVLFDDYRESAPGVISAVTQIQHSEPNSILSVVGTTAVLSLQK